MEGFETLKHTLEKGDWMVKLDLKDAFFTVPVCKEFQHYLQFVWEGVIYEYVCMPFGLAVAPWVFTKLLKPAIAFLRSLGIRLIIYLDDILILNQSRDELIKQLEVVKALLRSLGFLINIEKSDEIPAQTMEYLGLLVSSIELKYCLPKSKCDTIVALCRKAIKKATISLRDLASILGNFTWATLAVPYAPAHIRGVQTLYISNSRLNQGDLRVKIVLSNEAKVMGFQQVVRGPSKI